MGERRRYEGRVGRRAEEETGWSTTTEQRAPDAHPQPAPRKPVESPQAFYERITKREDARRLLQTLAGH